MYLKTTRFLVVGIQKSGFSVAKLLNKLGAKVVVYDQNRNDVINSNIEQLYKLGIDFTLDWEESLKNSDVLVLSPGVAVDNVIPITARNLKKRIVGELELASQLTTEPIVAITGTNGKTTTCSMISHVLDSINLSNKLVGNIGTPLSLAVEENFKGLLITEVSSFQLETISRFTPHISCVLNITEDHLDRHYNFENYLYLKSKIVMNLRESEYAVLNYDDEKVKEFATLTKGQVKWFSLKEKVNGVYVNEGSIYYMDEKVCDVSLLKLDGNHNVANFLVAVLVLKLLGVSNEQIQSGISTFLGVKHRIQEIKTINGITFYNDSKSTNSDSTIKAISSMEKPTVLILGGYDKNLDYSSLMKEIKTSNSIKKVVFTGKNAYKMFNFAQSENIEELSVIKDFNLAIKFAYLLAKENWNVLFSPATSSFDNFMGYEERGDKFIEIVSTLT